MCHLLQLIVPRPKAFAAPVVKADIPIVRIDKTLDDFASRLFSVTGM